jgi:hypothetical protein
MAPKETQVNMLKATRPLGLRSVVAGWGCALLVACGGGDAPSVPASPTLPPTVERDFGLLGAFGGTLGSQDIVVVTNSQGDWWGVYGSDASTDFKVAGLLTNWSAGSSSTRVRGAGNDWGRGTSYDVQIDVSLDPAVPTLSGTVTFATDTRVLAGGALPDPAYRIAEPATMATVRGRWDLTTSQGHSLSLNVADDGSVNGTLGPCTAYDSAIRPSVSGNNVYALVLRFEGGTSGCGVSDVVFGFAVAYRSVNGGQQLVIGAWNGWEAVFLAAAGKR